MAMVDAKFIHDLFADSALPALRLFHLLKIIRTHFVFPSEQAASLRRARANYCKSRTVSTKKRASAFSPRLAALITKTRFKSALPFSLSVHVHFLCTRAAVVFCSVFAARVCTANAESRNKPSGLRG